MRNRSRLAVGVLTLVLALDAVVSLWAIRHRDTVSARHDRLAEVRDRSDAVTHGVLAAQSAERAYIVTGDTSLLGPYESTRRVLAAEVRNVLDGARARDLVVRRDRAARALNDWLGQADAEVAAQRAGQRDDAMRLVAVDGPTFTSAREALAALATDIDAHADKAERDMTAQRSRITRLFVATIVGAFVLLLVAIGAFHRWVLAPLTRFSGAVRRVAAGRLEQRVAGTGPAEIVQLGNDVDDLRQRVLQEVADASQTNRMLEQEIGHRIRAEGARRESEEQLRLMVESVRDYAIIGVDSDGTVNSWNAGAERIYGYGRDEIVGRSIDVFHPDAADAAAGQRLLERAMVDGVGDAEGVRVRKDGTRFWASVVIAPVRDDDGHPRGFVKITRDITERKDMLDALEHQTAELARSNAELEQFAYVASHDLSEPLRAVSGYVQLLARRYEGQLGDGADELIAYAVRGVERMQRLIRDLLTYSRVTSAERAVEAVDCDRLVRELADGVIAGHGEPAPVITVDPLPTVAGDATQLTQLFQNLVSNAVKFVAPGVRPEVRVWAEHDDRAGAWRFFVQDNGIGIDADQRARIFKVFQRLHSQSEYDGTGVGLAICEKVAQRHGGAVSVDAAPEGGTVFSCTIADAPVPSAAAV